MKSLRISERYTKRESESFKRYLNDIASIKEFTLNEEVECSLRAESGDKNALDELIRRNLRFVVSVAKQYETANTNLEDLVNEGNIGLIMAAQQYKVSTGFKFITYAVYWIRKMIFEYLTKNSRLVKIPSNKVSGVNKLNQYIAELEQKHGRTVDISEVIDEYGEMLASDDIIGLEKISIMSFDSLDCAINDDGANLYDTIPDNSIKPTDHLISDNDLKSQLKNILNTLKPRNKQVIIDLFGLDDKPPVTITDISERTGLTKEAVRQIKENSLKRLKKKIRRY